MKRRQRRSVIERFWLKVDQTETCWLWTGALSRGYGRFYDGDRVRIAHRFAYEALIGPIPEGLTIDHLCRVSRCVNPAHLEPVTMRENVLRGDTLPARQLQRTHCPHGHPYDLLNTRWEKRNGQRHCRECQKIAARIARARKREAVAA